MGCAGDRGLGRWVVGCVDLSIFVFLFIPVNKLLVGYYRRWMSCFSFDSRKEW